MQRWILPRYLKWDKRLVHLWDPNIKGFVPGEIQTSVFSLSKVHQGEGREKLDQS